MQELDSTPLLRLLPCRCSSSSYVAAHLLKEGKTFNKHKEVRSALHRDLIRVGRINNSTWGKHYDWLFDNRQKADYRPFVQFGRDQAQEIIDQTSAFVGEMERLLSEDGIL